MKWIFLLLALVIPGLAYGQSYNAMTYTAGSFNAQGCRGSGGVCNIDLQTLGLTLPNGTMTYCKDCSMIPNGNTCGPGGNGALAVLINNTWICAVSPIQVTPPPVNAVFPPGPVNITGNSENGTDQITNVNVNGVINVKSYGAVGDNVHDDTIAIQNAITANIDTACIYFPVGQYRVTQDLNITSNSENAIHHPCIFGDNPATTAIDCQDAGGNCFDLAGSDAYVISNIQIQSLAASGTAAPKVLVLSARAQDASTGLGMADGFGYQMNNVWVGTSNTNTKYTWYNYGAEIGQLFGCRFGTDGDIGTQVVISATNTAGITSKYTTLISPVPPVSLWNTSMSVVNFYGGVISSSTTAGQPHNCAVLFDNQLPPGAPANTYTNIHDINFYGVFFGEGYNGSTVFCDTPNPVSGPTLGPFVVDSSRMESGDGNPANALLDFSHSYVANIDIRDFDMGVANPLNMSPVHIGYMDQSTIGAEFSGGLAAGVYALTGGGFRGGNLKNIAMSQIDPNLANPNNPGGWSGNIVQWMGAPGNGFLSAGGFNSTPPTGVLNGTTAGTVDYFNPIDTGYYKKQVLAFINYQNNTTTPQFVPYPHCFNTTPAEVGQCPAGMNLFNGCEAQLPTSMAAAFGGQCIIEGY